MHLHHYYPEIETLNKRWSGLLIGSLVLGGAAGAGIAALGSKKKTEAQTVLGPTDTEEGKKYKQTLEDRMAGIGLLPTTGYDPTVLSGATAPYAKTQREGFQNYTAPAISAKASSVGLGRSTIPVSQTRLGSQEVENSIAQRVQELTLANEEEKASERKYAEGEKTDAIKQYGVLTGDVTAGENAKYGSAYKTNLVNQDIAQTNKEDMIGGTLSGILGGGNLATGTTDLNSLLAKLLAQQKTSGSTGGGGVNLAGTPKLIGAMGKQGFGY